MKNTRMILPHDFILDMLYPLPTRTKKMFGVVSIYCGEKILFATRQKEDNPVDNGIWIATKLEHHEELRALIPELRNLETYKIKSWLLLHEEEPNFEERASQLVDLFKAGSPLVGTIPKPKKKK